MSNIKDRLFIPEGLHVLDQTAFMVKLEHFARLGATGLHALLDFDRTLTVKRPGSSDEVTTWHILNEHLPVQAQAEYQQYFDKYRALEVSGKMTTAHAVEWWSSILDLFVANGVSLAEVERTFFEKASIREYVTEFFADLNKHNIPSTILSAGIKNIIDLWVKKYNIKASLVLSTELEIDNTGVVVGWDKSTLVHVLNKHEADHFELAQIRENRPNTLLIGDGIDDATMAVGKANILRVRILDRRDDDPDLEIEKARTFESFDALITNGSMQPLCDLVDVMTGPPTI